MFEKHMMLTPFPRIRASKCQYGAFLSHRATPSHHPFRTAGFSRSQKPSSYGGTPISGSLHRNLRGISPLPVDELFWCCCRGSGNPDPCRWILRPTLTWGRFTMIWLWWSMELSSQLFYFQDHIDHDFWEICHRVGRIRSKKSVDYQYYDGYR